MILIIAQCEGRLMMKMRRILFVLIILTCSAFNLSAQENTDIVSLYKGSKLIYDDPIGFETFYYLSDATTIKSIEGKIRRQFCSAPEKVSPYEIIKNYESAMKAKGGAIIHLSRNALRFKDENNEWVWFIRKYFMHKRQVRMNHWGYMQLESKAEDYVVGKVSTPAKDYFVAVAAADVDNTTYYTVVTVAVEPMDMNNVTMNVLSEGIAANGRVPIYDIYFDTGKSDIKSESAKALNVIAEYLKANSDKTFLIVGHTDNVGHFDANITLSGARAQAVAKALVTTYNINKDQLKPYGIGSTSPQASNASEEGRSRNRRVELVEF